MTVYVRSSCVTRAFQVMVYMRSLDDETEYAEERREWEEKSRKAGCVRMELTGGFLMQVVGDASTRIRMINKVRAMRMGGGRGAQEPPAESRRARVRSIHDACRVPVA